MTSKLIYADGREKEVKNLGWLLSHWKEVDRFELTHGPGMFPHLEAILVAVLKPSEKGPVRYETGFASWRVLLYFLSRPVFLDVPAKLVRNGTPGALNCRIGDMRWEVCRMNSWFKVTDEELLQT